MRAQARGRGDAVEAGEFARHRRSHGWFVGVAEVAFIEPLLPDHEPVPAERPWRREARVSERSLDALRLIEVGLVGEQLVDLHRDPRPVVAAETEQCTNARAEEKDLPRGRIESVHPCSDLSSVERAEQVENDR